MTLLLLLTYYAYLIIVFLEIKCYYFILIRRSLLEKTAPLETVGGGL